MQNRRSKATKVVIVVLAVGAILACVGVFTWGPYSPLFWMFAPRQEIRVIVPDGYVGPVLIGWQVPDGESAEVADNVLIYRLHEDGALMLRDDPPGGVGQWSFWYEASDGHLARIPDSTCFDDAPETGIVVCVGMIVEVHNSQDFRPNEYYAITTVTDADRDFDKAEELLSTYADRLAR